MAAENLLQDNEYIPRRARSRNSNARPKIRMFSADQWARQNFILSRGELAFDDTAKRFKIGDGETTWNELEFLFIDVTGNTQGLMTVSQFTEYTALFEASLLAYQSEISEQLSGFQVQLDGFIETVDGLQTQFQEVLDNNVDLSTLISTETFNTYTNSQDTTNADFNNRLQTLESQNAADLSGYATQEWVTNQIANINVNIDLSSYATKAELQALNNAVGDNDNILAANIADLQQQINSIEVGAVDLTQVNNDIAAVNARIDALITDLQNGVYGTGGGGDGGETITYQSIMLNGDEVFYLNQDESFYLRYDATVTAQHQMLIAAAASDHLEMEITNSEGSVENIVTYGNNTGNIRGYFNVDAGDYKLFKITNKATAKQFTASLRT